MANITQKWVKLLLPFTNNYGQSISESELARLSGIPQQSASRHSKILVKSNILAFKIQGRNKLFQLDHSHPRTKVLYTILESQKSLNFFSSEKDAAVIIREIIPHAETVIVFGSFASGAASNVSDLDLVIVGKCDVAAIKRIKKRYVMEINDEHISFKDFSKLLRSKNALAVEILGNHVIFGNVSRTVDLFIEVSL